jgi:hypothetical protein
MAAPMLRHLWIVLLAAALALAGCALDPTCLAEEAAQTASFLETQAGQFDDIRAEADLSGAEALPMHLEAMYEARAAVDDADLPGCALRARAELINMMDTAILGYEFTLVRDEDKAEGAFNRSEQHRARYEAALAELAP